MSRDEQAYHLDRALQEEEAAAKAIDASVRDRHKELGQLHRAQVARVVVLDDRFTPTTSLGRQL